MQTKVFSEGSSTCQCKKGTLRACSDISSASNLLCSACREHGQSFTCDISLNRLLGPFVIFSTVSERHTASLFFVKNFHISLCKTISTPGRAERTQTKVFGYKDLQLFLKHGITTNCVQKDSNLSLLGSNHSSCQNKVLPEHRSSRTRQRLQTFRTKFYLHPAPKPWEEITFEILKGTLRACLYADF